MYQNLDNNNLTNSKTLNDKQCCSEYVNVFMIQRRGFIQKLRYEIELRLNGDSSVFILGNISSVLIALLCYEHVDLVHTPLQKSIQKRLCIHPSKY